MNRRQIIGGTAALFAGSEVATASTGPAHPQLDVIKAVERWLELECRLNNVECGMGDVRDVPEGAAIFAEQEQLEAIIAGDKSTDPETLAAKARWLIAQVEFSMVTIDHSGDAIGVTAHRILLAVATGFAQ